MKTSFKIMLLAAAALSFAACTKEAAEAQKSSECKITSFKAVNGTMSIDGFIDQAGKKIELAYMPDELASLKEATAEVKISDNATISPDPTVAADYTVEGGVQYTVTAEDGKTTNVYTIVIAEAEYMQSVNMQWEKTYGALDVQAPPTNQCGVAFSGLDIVFSDLNVVDLHGKHLGVVNTEGISGLEAYNGHFGSMSNDPQGVLVACCCYGGTDEGEGTMTEIWCWPNGWNEAPEMVLSTEYQCYYMSVGGDLMGDYVLNYRAEYNWDLGAQMHHVYQFRNGERLAENVEEWFGPFIPHVCTDGNWGQILSFPTGEARSEFVCWDSFEATEFGDEGNSSSAFYVYPSADDVSAETEVALYGQLNWTRWDEQDRHFLWGNFEAGHARAFRYNGQNYVIAMSTSWDSAWITIEKMDGLVEDDPDTDMEDESEANFLLPTSKIEGGGACFPVSAYVYDADTMTGYIVACAQGVCAQLWTISTEKM